MKILLIITLYISLIYSEKIKIKYDISFSFFGKIGEAHLTVKIDKNRYLIDIQAFFTGFAKVLSKNLRERHISKGFIHKNIFYSKEYKSIKIKQKIKKVTKISINYKNKKIYQIFHKYLENKLEEEKKTTLSKDKYSTDDILNIFFNIKHYIKKGKLTKYKIIGIKKEQMLEILVPSQKIIDNYSLLNNKTISKYIHIILNQTILSSKNGEIIAGLSNKDNFLDEAIVKDVLLLGDILIKRVN